MIEVEDRSRQLRERRISRAAHHIAKIPMREQPTLAAVPVAVTKPCVYRILLSPRGYEKRRWFVKPFEDDETAQQYALGRNLAASNDDIYVVVRKAA